MWEIYGEARASMVDRMGKGKRMRGLGSVIKFHASWGILSIRPPRAGGSHLYAWVNARKCTIGENVGVDWGGIDIDGLLFKIA